MVMWVGEAMLSSKVEGGGHPELVMGESNCPQLITPHLASRPLLEWRCLGLQVGGMVMGVSATLRAWKEQRSRRSTDAKREKG